MESSSITSSAKRAKAPGNVGQVAHCLVDGCNADLGQCRDYHRRHKVCELHSKTPKVTIGGREQRFCQQCSRFHSLIEFDEGKRSCRKRLDGHNRRRRKPQPDTLSRNSALLFSSQQGTRLLSFSSPQILPSAVVSSTWTGVAKTENDLVLYSNQPQLNYVDRHNSLPESSEHCYKGGNQFQLIQGTDRTLPETSMCQQLINSNSVPGHSNSGQKIFSDGLSHVAECDSALSLLSSVPPVSREIGLNHHMVHPNSISQAQTLGHNLQYSSLGQYPFASELDSKPVLSSSDSHGGSKSTQHFQGMFENGPDASSSSGSHQTLTFMWE